MNITRKLCESIINNFVNEARGEVYARAYTKDPHKAYARARNLVGGLEHVNDRVSAAGALDTVKYQLGKVDKKTGEYNDSYFGPVHFTPEEITTAEQGLKQSDVGNQPEVHSFLRYPYNPHAISNKPKVKDAPERGTKEQINNRKTFGPGAFDSFINARNAQGTVDVPKLGSSNGDHLYLKQFINKMSGNK